MKVRTRFAPSPTGLIHPGGMRTALFAWLLARSQGGSFLLRIEDTDTAREVEGAVDYLQDSLKWLGLDWDEEPVYQSKRLDIYKKYAQQLIESGHAYADPYSPTEVEDFRQQARQAKKPFLFRDFRPTNPPVWDGSQPLRFKVSELKKYSWQDAVRGELAAGPEMLDDFIIIKSDGYPTYNFAHIVDDHEMQITHVLRGEEFVASTPKFLAVYEAFGWSPPVMATMPLVLGREGGKKLSKRDGSLPVLDYRDQGYLAEGMNNFLATLGWNDGTEQEVFSTTELIEKFNISKIQKSPARFDVDRLIWINGSHIRNMPLDKLYDLSAKFWPEEANSSNPAYKKQVLGLVQERLKYLAELPELSRFFFVDLPLNPELIKTHKQLKKLSRQELKSLLEASKKSLGVSDFSVEDLTERLNQLLTETNQKPVVLFSLIRIAVTQAPASPSLADTLSVLGKDRSNRRLEAQLSEF